MQNFIMLQMLQLGLTVAVLYVMHRDTKKATGDTSQIAHIKAYAAKSGSPVLGKGKKKAPAKSKCRGK